MLLLVALLVALWPATGASAATLSEQCSGIAGAGLKIDCTVNVVNNVAENTSTVETIVCSGAAGTQLGTGLTCVTTPAGVPTPGLISSVNQCNGSLAGGSNVICRVNVTNVLAAAPVTSPATVNQCVGSLTSAPAAPMACDPFPATAVGADVTQCNGSANGGGATLTCEVSADSTTSTALRVTINQCNGSGNGGGSTILCRSSITNAMRAAVVIPTPTVAPSTPTPSSPAPAPTDSASPIPSSGTPAPSASATPGAPTTTESPADGTGTGAGSEDDDAAGDGGSGAGDDAGDEADDEDAADEADEESDDDESTEDDSTDEVDDADTPSTESEDSTPEEDVEDETPDLLAETGVDATNQGMLAVMLLALGSVAVLSGSIRRRRS